VLGDAMAMPVASLIEKFRPEIEAEIAAIQAGSLAYAAA
jgi:NADH:ubiquinone oxidoreductase subunit F (NADH-binding)